jgi:hypothetical protein
MGKVKTVVIQILVGVLLLEILLRCLYFQKLGNDKIAIVSAYKSLAFRATNDYRERLIKNHNLIRPDSAKVNANIVDEVIASNSFEYAPWAEFKLIDFTGRYVNSKGFLRKSDPSIYIGRGADTLKIFFFGGSTMFGFDVTDKESITSEFVNVTNEKCKDCKSINVYNYGVLSYYSYNELMLFHHLLATNHRPDIVVFLDGLNDLFIVQAAIKRVPWYYFRLKENIQNRKDSTLSLFQLLPGQTSTFAADGAINNYLENISHIRKLCAAFNVTPFFFIQPIPYYNYPRLKNDLVADSSRNEVIEYGYSVLKSYCDSTQNMHFLGDMLLNETKPPFIDEIHYSPYMNRMIAEEIFKRVQPKLIQ